MYKVKIDSGIRKAMQEMGTRNAGLWMRFRWDDGSVDVHVRHESWGTPSEIYKNYGAMHRLDRRITNKRIREIVAEMQDDIAAACSGWEIYDGPCGCRGRFTEDGYEATRRIWARIEAENERFI